MLTVSRRRAEPDPDIRHTTEFITLHNVRKTHQYGITSKLLNKEPVTAHLIKSTGCRSLPASIIVIDAAA